MFYKNEWKADMIRTIYQHLSLKVTNLPLVPALVHFLAKSPLVEQYDVSSVIESVCGAAPLAPKVAEQFQKRFNLTRTPIGKIKLVYKRRSAWFARTLIGICHLKSDKRFKSLCFKHVEHWFCHEIMYFHRKYNCLCKGYCLRYSILICSKK